jgi:hypothetical protein
MAVQQRGVPYINRVIPDRNKTTTRVSPAVVLRMECPANPEMAGFASMREARVGEGTLICT